MLLKYILQRLLKKKSNFVFLLILPIIFNIIFIYGMFENNSYKIGIIDEDGSELTGELDEYLGRKYTVIEYDSEEKAKSDLLNSKINCFLVWPIGFSESMTSKSPLNVGCYSIQESNASQLIKLELDGLLKSCRIIKNKSGNDSALFNERVKLFLKEETRIVNETVSDKNIDVENSVRSLGFLAMGIMFMIGTSTTIIFKDKESGVFKRIIASSMSMRQYFWENFLSFFIISTIQIFIVFVIVDLFMGVHYGGQFVRVLLCTYLFVIWCISFGMFISSLSKDMLRANAVIGFCNIILLMLGGCFWPKNIMPVFLQVISNLIPTGWYLSLAEKQMNLCNLTAGLAEGLLLLFSSCAFMYFAYKKYSYQ